MMKLNDDQKCVCVYLYIFQLVLKVCSFSLQQVSLVQRLLQTLSQSEDMGLLEVHLLLQLSLLRCQACTMIN